MIARHVFIIGMPGCGKSTVGKALAQRENRRFVDADEEIIKKIGDIPPFFAQFGEEAFRKVETEVLADLGKESGLVIATGGGCVTRQENYDLLHQNGTILWIKRDLEKLPISGRPVSQRDGVEAIYEKRKPLYEAFADGIVENNGTIEEALAQI